MVFVLLTFIEPYRLVLNELPQGKTKYVELAFIHVTFSRNSLWLIKKSFFINEFVKIIF